MHTCVCACVHAHTYTFIHACTLCITYVLQGTGDQYCEFKIDKIRDQGYITIESSSNRGLFLGMTPDGKIRPVVNTGDKNVRLYPEIVECKINFVVVYIPSDIVAFQHAHISKYVVKNFELSL